MVAGHFPLSNDYGAPAVCFDLDGTLAESTGSERLGDPTPLLALAERLTRRGWIVIVHSARPASHNRKVRDWLEDHSPYLAAEAEVACGVKPAADIFVDDKGLLLPIEAMEERIELAVTDPIKLWLDGTYDRPFTRQWIEVHDNPDWHGNEDDTSFRVVCSASGGLDSTTALGMAAEAGLPLVPVYVRGSAPYADHEQAAAERMLTRIGIAEPLLVLDPQVTYPTLNGYIDLGRNAVILWHLARVLRYSGWWGEVWFGNVGEWSEGPVRGGDKSHRFFGTMQQLLISCGFDVRIANPLAALRKADLVRWWVARGREDVPLASFSCFGPGPEHCGACRACFRRWVGLAMGGLRAEATAQLGGLGGLRSHAEHFMATLASDHSMTMAPGRVAGIPELLASAGLLEGALR